MSYEAALIVIGIIILTFGIIYAAIIAMWPPINWTLLSVIIGVGATLLLVDWWQYVALGAAAKWHYIFLDDIGFILTGLPMSIVQVIKHIRHKIKNAHLAANIAERKRGTNKIVAR